MDYSELHMHIEAGRGSRAAALFTRILDRCWPGGAADRNERAASEWLRRWHPERVGITLERCSCATGRCAVCN